MMDDSIPLDQFEQLRNSTTPPVVVDIRRASDFGADPAIIPGALRGDPERIYEWASTLPRDRDVIVYCVRGGSVSQAVRPKFGELGVRARYLAGGVTAWKVAGGKTSASQ